MIATPPCLEHSRYLTHGRRLLHSFRALIGHELIPRSSISSATEIMAAWRAPFAIVSHGVEENPIFNFGNHVALELFELDFDAFTKLPSVQSAEPLAREEREQLLATVSTQGFIANYSGVRISATGKRFQIENAIVWNIVDNKGGYHGQAATFETWTYL